MFPSLTCRQNALLKAASGSALFALVFYLTYREGDFVSTGRPLYALIGMGAPGALALIGVHELASGQPFSLLASAWDRLSRWRKVVYGLAVIIAAIIMIYGPLVLIGWIRDG